MMAHISLLYEKYCGISFQNKWNIETVLPPILYSSTSTKLAESLVLFLNYPTTPPTRNRRDYTFQEAEMLSPINPASWI